VGAVVAAQDVERVERLFRRLHEEIAQRRHETAARPDGDRDRPDDLAGRADIVLAVDGWELAVEAWAAYRHGRLIDDLLAILRDGGSAGIHVAVSGERAVLSGAPSALLTDRILLRFADPLTAVLAGVPVARLPAVQPPGRGLWLPADEGIFEVQLATVAAHPPGAEAEAEADAAPARARRSAPWPVPELPGRVARRTLVDGFPPVAEDHARRALLVGLAVDDRPSAATENRPYVAVGPDAVPGAVVSVLGPPGSGRSTALAALATAAHEADLDAVLVANGAPVAPTPPGAVLIDTSRPDAAEMLEAAVGRARRPVVLVDDAGDLGDDLSQIVLATLPRAPVVIAASAADVLGSYGGLLGAARKARSGLFLGAVRAGDGEALGVRLDPAPAGLPGRGRLIRRGRVVAVQVAEPDPVVRREGLARRPVTAQ
jgi:S-DNA-T family DNA segregation ATPase FtsK/SpoIIIE